MTFQSRVQKWMVACFGEEVSADRLERGDRLLEEVFELLQSVDYPRERIRALEAYVHDRTKGEPEQEVGGVMLTLAAFCEPHGLDMHQAGETELVGLWGKIDKIRAKQAAKPHGSALPVAVHADDIAVDRFATAMKAKLAAKRAQGYGGWDRPEECRVEFLSQLLQEHVRKGDPVDVANFSMMLHQRGSKILPAEASHV